MCTCENIAGSFAALTLVLWCGNSNAEEVNDRPTPQAVRVLPLYAICMLNDDKLDSEQIYICVCVLALLLVLSHCYCW